MGLYDRIFNRWSKWELIQSNVPQIKDVRNSPLLGSVLISRTRVFVNIYMKTNNYTGNVKTKKVVIN